MDDEFVMVNPLQSSVMFDARILKQVPPVEVTLADRLYIVFAVVRLEQLVIVGLISPAIPTRRNNRIGSVFNQTTWHLVSISPSR